MRGSSIVGRVVDARRPHDGAGRRPRTARASPSRANPSAARCRSTTPRLRDGRAATTRGSGGDPWQGDGVTQVSDRPAGSILGTRVLRTEDPGLLTGQQPVRQRPPPARQAARRVRPLRGGPRRAAARSTSTTPRRHRASSPCSPPPTSASRRTTASSRSTPTSPDAPLADGVVRFVGEAIAHRPRRDGRRRRPTAPPPVWADYEPLAGRSSIPRTRVRRRGAP